MVEDKGKEARGEEGVSPKAILAFFILLSVVGVLYYMSGGEKVGEPKFEKVLVLGLDGMDPRITSKLMSEGKLPNFERLADSGSFINLNTSYPPHSPVAWTSIATGVNPGKHNIFDFIRRNPKNNLPMLSLAKSVSGIAGTDYKPYVRSPQFWELTSGAGVSTSVIRWPVSFPPERIEGNLLSGLGVPDVKGLLSGYTFYTTESVKGEKVVRVSRKGDVIDTVVSGPRKREGGELVDVTVPLHVRVLGDDSVQVTVSGESYTVSEGEWSDWMRAKFHVGFLNDVFGTFKAYLVSVEPFKMYVTTIQIDPRNPMVSISHPGGYSKSLAEEVGDYYTLGMPEETDGFMDGRFDGEGMVSQIRDIEGERDAMFWEEFRKFKEMDSGVFGFVYDSSDRLQHVFWEDELLGDRDDGVLSLNQNVVDYWVGKDEFLGRLLDELGEDTLLLVVSDHGFTSFERSVCLNKWLLDNGFLSLTKELGEGEEGGLFRYVDWSKTKAFAVGFNSIYVNLRGREAMGVVEDRQVVVDEIISELESLRDEELGEDVVFKAHDTRKVYSGGQASMGPDVIVGYYPGYRTGWQTAVGGFADEVIMDNEKVWDGDHLVDPSFVPGVLFSNVKLEQDSAAQVDVAPTILDAMGVRIPEEMDGESLLE